VSTDFGKSVVKHLRETLELFEKVNENNILRNFRGVLEDVTAWLLNYLFTKVFDEKECIEERKKLKYALFKDLYDYLVGKGKIYVFIVPYFDSDNYACMICCTEHGKIVPVIFLTYNIAAFSPIKISKLLYLYLRSSLASVCCYASERHKISEYECFRHVDECMDLITNHEYKCSWYFYDLIEKPTSRDIEIMREYCDAVIDDLYAKVKMFEIPKLPEVRYDFCSRILPRLKELKDIEAIKEITDVLAKYKLGFEIKPL